MMYEINPLSSPFNNIYRINSPSSNEYFVIEYRVKEGIYEINTPGGDNGILIYRVNDSLNGNADGPPDELYLYRPNGTFTISKSKKKTLVASNNSDFVLIWGAIYVVSGKYSCTVYLCYILNFTGKVSIFVNIFLASPILFLQIY